MSTLFDNSMEFENIERSSVPALDAALAQNVLTTRVEMIATPNMWSLMKMQRAMLVDLMLAELADLRTAEDDFDKGEARKLATSELMTRVTEDQMIELQSTAMEWSETGPPPEIRARCAVKMRGHIIRDFQEQLYKFCGVRTFVLCAFLDEGKVIQACG
ncbi:hypothetical protein BC834DRAFT_846365 [Gloeopeniophorella convolvens]|nr:hypothetical protein BC834DRAFT_846365 [Gloeopeniophorella convolvens]